MPKVERESNQEFNLRIIREYPKVFRADNSVLFCIVCDRKISAKKLFLVKQHLETKKHKRNEEMKFAVPSRQTLVTTSFLASHGEINIFYMDICKTFLESNIPINRIGHPSIVTFLEKYTTRTVPSESVLRKKYVPLLYNQCLEEMRAKAQNKAIWVSLDETTDSEQRFVANFVFGLMEEASSENKERGKCYLLDFAVLEEVNATRISTFFVNSLLLLWPQGIEYDKVLLVVTDAASYMISSMRSLTILFPKMLHLTCFAHGLHRIADFTRLKYPAVNRLISKVKAVFVKAPARRLKFRIDCPGVALPPEPIITRWCSWITAAVYYCDNFVAVRAVVDSFSSKDAESIREAQELFGSTNIQSELAFIKANFSSIVRGIKKLETPGLELIESFRIIDTIHTDLESLGQKEFLKKMDDVLRRNVGYEILRQIRDVLYNGAETENEYIKGLSPAELAMFKYCPTTSTDVERMFSAYNCIFSDKRKNFVFDNLKKHVILNCNRYKTE